MYHNHLFKLSVGVDELYLTEHSLVGLLKSDYIMQHTHTHTSMNNANFSPVNMSGDGFCHRTVKAASLVMREADRGGISAETYATGLFTHMKQLSPTENKSKQNLIIFLLY